MVPLYSPLVLATIYGILATNQRVFRGLLNMLVNALKELSKLFMMQLPLNLNNFLSFSLNLSKKIYRQRKKKNVL